MSLNKLQNVFRVESDKIKSYCSNEIKYTFRFKLLNNNYHNVWPIRLIINSLLL